jgi:Asp-tRNA(Asn)/Glu-tRNA(Gln) amidotransferase A subunit family amidase
MTAVELARAIASGERSAVEEIAARIRRVERHDPKLNAARPGVGAADGV